MSQMSYWKCKDCEYLVDISEVCGCKTYQCEITGGELELRNCVKEEE